MAAGAGSALRLSGIELFRMGQTNIKGRYPFHLHLVGDASGDLMASGSFLEASSVHRSYFKAAVIHGTSHASVSQNVFFDVVGHAVYNHDYG